MVEGDDIDATLCDPRNAACAIDRDLDDVTLTFQILLDEPTQARIVIDVENASAGCGH
jgi:hypothetical protein